MNGRRKYDRDFKRNAVLLSQEPGRTVSLGIGKIFYIVGDVNTCTQMVNQPFLEMESKL